MKPISFFTHQFRRNRSLLIFFALMVIVRVSVADHYRVPTGSMLPQIQLGEHILVDKRAYDLKIPMTHVSLERTGEPVRGDVIVFESPTDDGLTLVKRLIAGPGDAVEIEDGFVKVNGAWLSGTDQGRLAVARAIESGEERIGYVEEQNGRHYLVRRLPFQARRERLKLRVPEGHYFFMGDNRDQSADSRIWGFVPRENLKGRARMAIGLDGLSSLDEAASSVD